MNERIGGSDSCSATGIPSLAEIFARRARAVPDAPAITAPGKTALTYGRLYDQLQSVLQVLRASGLSATSRVAVTLPHGPEMAVSLLGILTSAVCAPLNPSFSQEEFGFFLSDLRADALLADENSGGAAIDAARSLDIPVIFLTAEKTDVAGLFRLSKVKIRQPSLNGFSRPQDLALLLHTSGTTSRPKLVPLSQANICHSAEHISASLELRPGDRCLSIMPLFHVHGLIGALISSLLAGSCVFCPPGFDAADFFAWWEEFRPTWYTAVPTMHQSILAKIRGRESLIHRYPPRFLRSCSAPLSPALLEELENAFRAPCLEAYGMTEAAHQIASNPLPPRMRKLGSVGLPTGFEISILDERGEMLPSGATGEVALRGMSLTAGYENNPEANARSFIRGWFRTGDRGYLDDQGYLFLTGRIKEIINRGGEKISPREIDEVLLLHPAVDQAAAFAVPDKRLGEVVGAAIVLRPDAKTSEAEIRSFAAQKMAYFKVPARIVFVDEIPKTSTGKVQRIGLAKALGLEDGSGRNVRRALAGGKRGTRLEKHILEIFRKITGRSEIDPEDHFFRDCEGDSLDAARLLTAVEMKYGVRIPPNSFVIDPTPVGLAALIREKDSKKVDPLFALKTGGRLPPLFLVHPHDGKAVLYFKLARYLDDDLPIFCFQSPSESFLKPRPGGIEEIARVYVREMTAGQKQGPYFLGGYCFGAWIALEMARQIEKENRAVEFLALIDGYAPGYPLAREGIRLAELRLCLLFDKLRRFRAFLSYLFQTRKETVKRDIGELLRFQTRKIFSDLHRLVNSPGQTAFLPGREEDWRWAYHPKSYPGRASVFRPSREPLGFERAPYLGWEKFVAGGISCKSIPGYHRTLIFEPRVRHLGRSLMESLKKAL